MTITTDQLDELEMRAKRAKDEDHTWFDEAFDVEDVSNNSARHIAANSPDVTLQLIAIARAALAWRGAKLADPTFHAPDSDLMAALEKS